MRKDIYPVQIMRRREKQKPVSSYLPVENVKNIIKRAAYYNGTGDGISGGLNLKVDDIAVVGDEDGNYGNVKVIYRLKIEGEYLDDLKRGMITIPVLEQIRSASIPNVSMNDDPYGYFSGELKLMYALPQDEITAKVTNLIPYKLVEFNGMGEIGTRNIKKWGLDFISEAIKDLAPNQLYYNNGRSRSYVGGFYNAIQEIGEITGLYEVEVEEGAGVAALSNVHIAEFNIIPSSKLSSAISDSLVTNLEIVSINTWAS